MQKFCHIGFTVMTFPTRVTGRIDTRGTAQGIHFQTGIVGKHIEMIMVVYILRFLQGVTFEGAGCLRNIHITSYVLQRHDLKRISQNILDLTQFILIVGGKYYFHSFTFGTFTLMASNPSPKTPMTLLCLTKALGSIVLMSRKI